MTNAIKRSKRTGHWRVCPPVLRESPQPRAALPRLCGERCRLGASYCENPGFLVARPPWHGALFRVPIPGPHAASCRAGALFPLARFVRRDRNRDARPSRTPPGPFKPANSAAVALAQHTRARVRSLDGPPQSTSGWNPLRWAPTRLPGLPTASRAPISRLASISTGEKLRNRTGKLSTRTWQANFGIAPKRCFEAQRDSPGWPAKQTTREQSCTPNPIDTRTQARTRHKVKENNTDSHLHSLGA